MSHLQCALGGLPDYGKCFREDTFEYLVLGVPGLSLYLLLLVRRCRIPISIFERDKLILMVFTRLGDPGSEFISLSLELAVGELRDFWLERICIFDYNLKRPEGSFILRADYLF